MDDTSKGTVDRGMLGISRPKNDRGQSWHLGEINFRGETGIEVAAVDDELHWCGRCLQLLPAADFRPQARSRTGLYHYCRTCVTEYGRVWRAANREDVERYNAERRRDYAIERGPLERQCANPDCGRSFTPTRKDAKSCSQSCRDRLKYLRRQGSG